MLLLLLLLVVVVVVMVVLLLRRRRLRVGLLRLLLIGKDDVVRNRDDAVG